MPDKTTLGVKYVSLADAAQSLRCTVAELIHWGATGQIRLGVLLPTYGTDPRFARTETGGFCFRATVDRREFAYLDRGQIQEIEAGQSAHPNWVRLEDGAVVTHSVDTSLGDISVSLSVSPEPWSFGADSLWIQKSEAERVRAILTSSEDANEGDAAEKSDPKNKLPDMKSSMSSKSCSEDAAAPKPLTTALIVQLFGSHMGLENPAKVMSEYPKWATANGALIRRGERGLTGESDVSAWNPVRFALNLLEKAPVIPSLGQRLTARNLDTVFEFRQLADWKEEWKSKRPIQSISKR